MSLISSIMQFDWLSASMEARQILFRHSKRLVDRLYAGNWTPFYEAILGITLDIGVGYEDNFRSGRISRKKAHAIYRWISVHHTQTAVAIDKDLERLPPATQKHDWDDWLEANASVTGLSLIKITDIDLGIVGFAGSNGTSVAQLALGEEFCFALDVEMNCTVLALQCVRSVWYPLPLSDHSLTDLAYAGRQYLPKGSSGGALPLCEASEAGLHHFVFLCASDEHIANIVQGLRPSNPILRDSLKNFAELASRHKLRAYQTKAIFN